jgi:putative Mn2+ efflux pump MntP
VSFPALLLLAVGLAMDATAVAACRGLAADRIRARDVLLVALLFGGFQAAMPLAGWLLGSSAGAAVEAWDHWIAFVLLAAIGGKMLLDARRDHEDTPVAAPFAPRALLLLAVATSIDALAAGVALSMVDVALAPAVATIGVTTALLSGAAVLLGRRLGAAIGRRLDAFGGLVLIALGVKILVEHLAHA